jgi:VIT1/CCC1 family predicted Fe2+/Mn2+ transporter
VATLDHWAEERQSAWLYRQVATAEPDPEKRQLFLDLSRAAEAQAELWARKLAGAGRTVPSAWTPSARARAVAVLTRRIGPRRARPLLAALKVRGLSVYARRLAPATHAMPTSLSDFGQRHRSVSSGGTLRATVFGVNDGLVSNASLILGVAGAEVDERFVLLAGTAGLLAGAFSMAAGEYVSVRSQRELYEHQIGLERAELEAYPAEEAEELALVYRARGLSLDEARALAQRLLAQPELALDTLAREELGLDPAELGSPWGAATSSFLAFACGALLPLLPFLLAPRSSPAVLAAGLAGLALFGIGCALSFFTGRSWLLSGLRMMAIGGAATGITWLVGRLLGVAVS